ncbi:MAG: glycosyltransferase [Chitinophagaceae bacterium]|nr:glycosyltransferase [Chitinophagaceae bacterium]
MKATILLITFNHEKFIRKAIDSILFQKDLPDCEIIVSDDHSTDATLQIAKELLIDRPAVNIYSNEKNLGVTRNYEKAFLLCKGEYIFVLEGDDYWIDPFKVKKQIEFMDQHPFCSMCGHPYYMQQDELSIFTPPALAGNEDYNFFDCKDLILDPSLVDNFSVGCYRRAVLQMIAPETYNTISYDWMINISVAQFGWIGRINSPMSVYRISRQGVWSGIPMKERLEGSIDRIAEYDHILEKRYSFYFQKTQQKVKEQLEALNHPRKPHIPLKAYIPPIVLKILKLIIPPAFIQIYLNNRKP